jgi:fructosamine-3-kinase
MTDMEKILISSNSQADIYLVTGTDDSRYIVKESQNRFLLESEAKMLEYLRPFIRVPSVLSQDADRLQMEYIPNDSGCKRACEYDVAEVLVHLHCQSAQAFGFAYDTTIGPFRQSNKEHARWIDFYREERVMDFARKACDEAQISRQLLARIERFCGDFEAYLQEPAAPSLLHGDIWSGNVLSQAGRFAALIDPAIYYGHYEMELAFIGMFNTFGQGFYARYDAMMGIAPDFFESRAHIYRLFPYLVHVRAFGSGYLGGLESILHRFGY